MWFSKSRRADQRQGEEKPSERLVEQRVRNRIMEEVWGLSKGDSEAAKAGPTEWFETFFEWFPYEGEPTWYPAMTEEEASAVREVCALMQQAISDPRIPKQPSVEELTRTGWPERIAPVARLSSDLMLQRGRFSEDIEEEVPSGPTDLWQS
ncbi:hypothetical protein [Leptolyngbya sp. 7M]|uniref:hypothetical protein n=1 Tax=Leptolyngbya sp. 7M TaxID=2812896 RepID=UPI001B8CD68E|nr:hypothetical protein [Leptolyngbya sp. 7M]QYO63957.1 hypothetical protein JVX88_29830 [Leptolyngbya sp. 7M]